MPVNVLYNDGVIIEHSNDEVDALRARVDELEELHEGDQIIIRRWEKLIDQQQAKLDIIWDALHRHPHCLKHPDDKPIACGWKQAILDIRHALQEPQ